MSFFGLKERGDEKRAQDDARGCPPLKVASTPLLPPLENIHKKISHAYVLKTFSLLLERRVKRGFPSLLSSFASKGGKHVSHNIIHASLIMYTLLLPPYPSMEDTKNYLNK